MSINYSEMLFIDIGVGKLLYDHDYLFGVLLIVLFNGNNTKMILVKLIFEVIRNHNTLLNEYVILNRG